MNKADLVLAVSKEIGCTQKMVEAVINSVMATISKHVAKGQKVTLVGFGTFESRKRKPRSGRNPKTNEPLHIPAKTVAKFSVGKEFAEEVSKKR